MILTCGVLSVECIHPLNILEKLEMNFSENNTTISRTLDVIYYLSSFLRWVYYDNTHGDNREERDGINKQMCR